jgi:hypothetical protein
MALVSMLVMMMVVITGMRTGRLNPVAAEIGDRLNRIGLPGHHHLYPALLKLLHKARTGAAGDQDIHLIQRMGIVPPAELMDGHALIQIDPADLARLSLGADLIHEKPARLAGVGGNGPEILTGNCDLHRYDFLKTATQGMVICISQEIAAYMPKLFSIVIS